jgi:lipoprotein-releasing system permease protein
MNLTLFIARRYLFSKRKRNFINVISIIASVAVVIITAAIIMVLSTFNGLSDLLRSLNNSFDPEIKIESKRGKSFEVNPELLEKIKAVEGVEVVTEVIEDYAYVEYNGASEVVTMKGVSDNFLDQNRIPAANIVEGSLRLKDGDTNYAILGYGVKATLSVMIEGNFYPMKFYYVKEVKSGLSNPYVQRNIMPGGVFSIVQNFDANYVIVPLSFAEDLLNYADRRTSLEIKTGGPEAVNVEDNLTKLLGDDFNVLNTDEQHIELYRVVKLEKLFAALASVLLMIVGALNIYFSLMMLVLDKKRDISILSALGAGRGLIRRIFLTEGILIASIGTILGLLIGIALVWMQQEFGLISMGMANSVTEGYPVKLQLTDIFYISLMMISVTVLISYRPALAASRFSPVDTL